MIQTISEGEITGIAIVIDSITDIFGIDLRDKVIIIKRLDQELLSNLFDIKGIIVEDGGFLSHTSIFLREANIPCKRIKDATKIYVDGISVELK